MARRVYPTVPTKVEYSLTKYGKSLKRALKAICDWGDNHTARIGLWQRYLIRLGKRPVRGRECNTRFESLFGVIAEFPKSYAKRIMKAV